MHPPAPPCTPRAGGAAFACRDSDPQLVAASIGTAKSTHPMPVLRQLWGQSGWHVSSVPAPVAKGDILGPRLRVLQGGFARHLGSRRPCHAAPPCPSGQDVTLRPRDVPKSPRSVPKTPPPGPPALTQDGRPPLAPPATLALIKDGRPRRVPPRASCPHPRWPPPRADWLVCPGGHVE